MQFEDLDSALVASVDHMEQSNLISLEAASRDSELVVLQVSLLLLLISFSLLFFCSDVIRVAARGIGIVVVFKSHRSLRSSRLGYCYSSAVDTIKKHATSFSSSLFTSNTFCVSSSAKRISLLSFAFYYPVRSYVRIVIHMSTVLQQIVCLSCCLVCLVKRSVKNLRALSESPLEVYVSTRRVVTLCPWFHCF